jgi:hypothetical protein
MCLQNMTSYVQSRALVDGQLHTLIPFQTKGSILPRARLNIVQAARYRKADYILFVDTDQTFPNDTLHRLLKARRDIIACNITTKEIPASPTARDKARKPIYTDPGGPQYERVWRVGCGIMLVRTAVFDKIGLNCWEILWQPELNDYQGEDWRFCELAEAAGYEIWVDHHLSWEVGHLGEYCYKHDVVGEVVKETLYA